MHIFGHFRTVITHKHYVFIHCVRAGIIWRGIVHDLSKFSPTEFIVSAKFYTGTESPIPHERSKNGYSKVWMHHTRHNKHHIEYWMDNNMGNIIPVKMPLKYVIEMFCDMVAASKVYIRASGQVYTDDAPLNYLRKKGMNAKMHPDTAKLIDSLFVYLAENGEKKAFKYIRKLKKKNVY